MVMVESDDYEVGNTQVGEGSSKDPTWIWCNGSRDITAKDVSWDRYQGSSAKLELVDGVSIRLY